MKKKFFGILAATIGLSGAFAFNSPSKFQTSYYLLPQGSCETWAGQGQPAADQNLSHYTTVSSTFTCVSPLSCVCTYTVDGSGVIRQSKQGKYVN